MSEKKQSELLNPGITDLVLGDVLEERKRQDAKWGEQTHHPHGWLAILMEEVGEAAKAALDTWDDPIDIDAFREELIEIAAVAVAAVEDWDRTAGFKAWLEAPAS